jgi:type I protein arginine methyltransferase
MSCLTPTVMKEPLVDVVNSDMLMSNAYKVLDLDLVNMDKDEVNFSHTYKLKMNYNDRVHGIVAWFDTPFSRLTRPNLLSTSPFKKYTHWKQTVFYTEQDIDVRQGDTIFGSIAVRQSKTNFRELDIKISYHIDTPIQKKEFVNMYKLK